MSVNKKKSCMVFETLNSVSDMEILESKSDGAVRLHGVFGVCGIKNGNNRVYSKENYGKMVESLQKVIATEGCLGELEHPNTMNIDLNKVSHKIESIEMNEDGTITGTIRLLDTEKGKNAKAIVEAGCPLFISSRGAGSIDESGNVTLSTIKTYDLVGTPGFSQAKLTLKENQTMECLNESLAVIYESDDLLGDDEDNKDNDKKDDEKKDDDQKDNDKSSEDNDKKDEEPKDDVKSNEEDNNKDNNNKVTMEDIKNALDKLSEKVTSLEAELHIAQESLKDVKPVNYSAIETWVRDEFGNEFKSEVKEAILDEVDGKINESHNAIATGVTKWIAEEYTPTVEQFINVDFAERVDKWITEEYSPMLQDWICEHYDGEIKNYVNGEFAGNIEKWVNEEFAGTINAWVNEEFTPTMHKYINEEYTQQLQNWINEEFVPEQKKNILNEAMNTVNEFMESRKDDRLSQIDKMLESIESFGNNDAVNKIVKEEQANNKFKGVYVVENMPSQYAPLWNGISEAKQNEIIRSSRMYDFTKAGVMESFWANVDFSEKPIVENKGVQPEMNNHYNNVAARMRQLRS